jgi:hypothetical protein
VRVVDLVVGANKSYICNILRFDQARLPTVSGSNEALSNGAGPELAGSGISDIEEQQNSIYRYAP